MRHVPIGFDTRSLRSTWRNLQRFCPPALVLAGAFIVQLLLFPGDDGLDSRERLTLALFIFMFVWFFTFWRISAYLNRRGLANRPAARVFLVGLLANVSILTMVDNTDHLDLTALSTLLFVLPIGYHMYPQTYRKVLVALLLSVLGYLAWATSFGSHFWVVLLNLVGFAALSLLVQKTIYQNRLDRYVYQLQILEANGELQQLATRDSLTSLFNRRHYETLLRSEWHRAKRHKHEFVLLVLDLDKFKHINDTQGHLVGDEVLRQTGQLFESKLRSCDHAARTGGEEFVILLVETDRSGAVIFANRLRRELAELPCSKELPAPVTVSIGVALASEAQDELELQRLADRRLYAAKAQGRDCVVAEGDGNLA